jgi:hypothetical protein
LARCTQPSASDSTALRTRAEQTFGLKPNKLAIHGARHGLQCNVILGAVQSVNDSTALQGQPDNPIVVLLVHWREGADTVRLHGSQALVHTAAVAHYQPITASDGSVYDHAEDQAAVASRKSEETAQNIIDASRLSVWHVAVAAGNLSATTATQQQHLS